MLNLEFIIQQESTDDEILSLQPIETTKPLSKVKYNFIFKTIEESVVYHENIVNTLKDSKDDNDINMVKLS